MKSKLFLLTSFLSVVTVFGAVPVVAQQTITRPDSLQDLGYGGFMANSSGSVITGGVVSGKVSIQGNPLLWQPLTVTITCANGKIAGTTRTNVEGQFVISSVNVPRAYASESLTQKMAQFYEDCSVTVPLAGYHGNSVVLREKYLRDHPYLPAIVLKKDELAPGSHFSSTTQSASPAAQQAYQRAHVAWLHRDASQAESLLKQTVQLDPKFAEAWYLLGRLQMGEGLDVAKASLIRAHDADPQFVQPCTWLAAIGVQQRNWQEAGKWAALALKLYPAGTPRIWYYNAQADFHLGKNEAAHSAAAKALALDPEHSEVPTAEQLLALTLADKGDYSGAITHLRNTLDYIQGEASQNLVKRQIAFMEQQAAKHQ